mmetsp:Transcript_31477/g.73546  ORF Transcript_31477/g.73546 Transcript_31477/m.73546 type:complete len:94 (-) Transcript_31477:1690-1971(-)
MARSVKRTRPVNPAGGPADVSSVGGGDALATDDGGGGDLDRISACVVAHAAEVFAAGREVEAAGPRGGGAVVDAAGPACAAGSRSMTGRGDRH